MAALPRILDANANRAREALRVMEDAARFALDDEPLTREIKAIRHALRDHLALLPSGWLELNRDTSGDVGTSVKAPREYDRANLHDVVIAAGKRLGEALRVMEEVAKTIEPKLAAALEPLRYRAYAAETRLREQLGSAARRQWRLCVLLTESLCQRPWHDVLRAAIDAGADCIQVREKSLDAGALLGRLRAVIEIARPAEVSVIVNDRVDLALAAGTDGVHLGVNDLPVAEARRLAGSALLIGASTHDLGEAERAIRAGADYCGIGTMFPSALKPERAAAGPACARQYLDRFARVPHLAIGGITPDNLGALLDVGVQGIAVSSAVCGADDPGAVVAALLEPLRVASSSSSSPTVPRTPASGLTGLSG